MGNFKPTEVGDQLVATYKRWNRTAIECYESKADCGTCAIAKHPIGFHKDVNCHMPKAVDFLLAAGIPIPKSIPDRDVPWWVDGKPL